MSIRNAIGWTSTLCVLAAVCRADDSALEGAGGNIVPMKGHPSIRMVEEEVRIKLPECKVEARFVFKNEGPATKVLIGFPEQGKDTTPQSNTHLAGFKSWVDGTLVKTKQIFTQRPDETTNDNYYKAWWVKEVPFAAGQTRTIVDRYSGGMLSTSYGVLGFNYILETGRSWHGPIGRARIVCDVSALKDKGPIHFLLKGGVRSGSTISWDIRNFKPDEDIWIGWFDGFAQVHVNRQRAEKFSEMFDLPVWASQDPRPIRIGDEVWASIRTVARWLDVTWKLVDSGKRIRFEREGKWIELRAGSRDIRTSAGPSRIDLAVYSKDDSMMAPLTTVVTALGGSAHWNAKGWLDITMPRSTTSLTAAGR